MESGGVRDNLLRVLRDHAVLRGDFVLSSGQRSSYYLDARLVTLSARGSALVAVLLLDAFGSNPPDAVAGLAVGADPIVASIACMAGVRGLAVDGLIVRKESKAHGTSRRIEGPWRGGMRVAIVDDTFTTGGSALQAAKVISEAGGSITGVYALIDREEGAREAIEAAGYRYCPLYAASEILSGG